VPASAPKESFDRLTRVVLQLLGVPVALVSLVDDSNAAKYAHGDRQAASKSAGLSKQRET
jgi:hypothetical protein